MVCRWSSFPSTDAQHFTGLLGLIAAKTWPRLHSFREGSNPFTDDDLSVVIRAMPWITSLDIFCSLESFQPSTMDLLRLLFVSLMILRLRNDNTTAMCPIAQEVLSSCPLLELPASRIDATLVAEGKPWVCLGLKILELNIYFDPSTISTKQPLVFSQLARLSRLQVLRLWGHMIRDDTTQAPFQEAVDLMDLVGFRGFDPPRSLLSGIRNRGWRDKR
jgi:hypothetical protein